MLKNTKLKLVTCLLTAMNFYSMESQVNKNSHQLSQVQESDKIIEKSLNKLKPNNHEIIKMEQKQYDDLTSGVNEKTLEIITNNAFENGLTLFQYFYLTTTPMQIRLLFNWIIHHMKEIQILKKENQQLKEIIENSQDREQEILIRLQNIEAQQTNIAILKTGMMYLGMGMFSMLCYQIGRNLLLTK